MSEDEKKKYSDDSFIIGVFDQQEVKHYSSSVKDLSLDEKCPLGLQGRNQRVIKSLGTDISGINLNEDGFTVQYREGDTCFYQNNADYKFSSEVRFICDHDEDEGWPQLIQDRNNGNNNPCHLVFEWRTKQACRHCANYEVT